MTIFLQVSNLTNFCDTFFAVSEEVFRDMLLSNIYCKTGCVIGLIAMFFSPRDLSYNRLENLTSGMFRGILTLKTL